MALEPRFALVLVGSSGEGGAKPHRRNFGEAVENLTASGQYHWMAGNFLKYGAAEASFGSQNANDIPVDAHELIALCAPRPTYPSAIPGGSAIPLLARRGADRKRRRERVRLACSRSLRTHHGPPSPHTPPELVEV